jgi:hypothetical protein
LKVGIQGRDIGIVGVVDFDFYFVSLIIKQGFRNIKDETCIAAAVFPNLAAIYKNSGDLVTAFKF